MRIFSAAQVESRAAVMGNDVGTTAPASVRACICCELLFCCFGGNADARLQQLCHAVLRCASNEWAQSVRDMPF